MSRTRPTPTFAIYQRYPGAWGYVFKEWVTEPDVDIQATPFENALRNSRYFDEGDFLVQRFNRGESGSPVQVVAFEVSRVSIPHLKIEQVS